MTIKLTLTESAACAIDPAILAELAAMHLLQAAVAHCAHRNQTAKFHKQRAAELSKESDKLATSYIFRARPTCDTGNK